MACRSQRFLAKPAEPGPGVAALLLDPSGDKGFMSDSVAVPAVVGLAPSGVLNHELRRPCEHVHPLVFARWQDASN